MAEKRSRPRATALDTQPALSDRHFARIAKALAEPRRYEILAEIGRRAAATPCAAIAESQPISPATLSHHLKELESAGLIHIERHGRCANLTLERGVLRAYLDRLGSI